MGWQVKNQAVSAALGFLFVVGLIALWAWVWLAVFGFSLLQVVADGILVTVAFLLAAGLGPATVKKANI